MRRPYSVIAVALALVLAPAARAAEQKIAVINTTSAMNDNDEGKAIIAGLDKDLAEKQKVLEAKQKEFTALREDFEKQASLMNDETKKAKQVELQKRFEEVQQLVQRGQQEFDNRLSEAQKGVEGRVRQLVKEIAEAEGFTVVLDERAVVWSAGTLDITNEVIRKYNTKFPYKGGKGGAPAPKPAKPAGGKTK